MKSWASLTDEEKNYLRGSFFDFDMQRLEQTPADDKVFPILAGGWPNRNIGARQMKCSCCGGFIALSPTGVDLYERNTLRPILCEPCFEMLQALVARQEVAL